MPWFRELNHFRAVPSARTLVGGTVLLLAITWLTAHPAAGNVKGAQPFLQHPSLMGIHISAHARAQHSRPCVAPPKSKEEETTLSAVGQDGGGATETSERKELVAER